MSLDLITVTAENIHWAVNENWKRVYAELAYKVPINGTARLEGNLDMAGYQVYGIRVVENNAAQPVIPDPSFSYLAPWEYQILDEQADPGFEALTPPVSGWQPPAAGPFGAGLASMQTPPGNNLWPLRTVLWMRKSILLGPFVGGALEVTAENGCVIFMNGVLLGSVNRTNVDDVNIPPTQIFNLPHPTPATPLMVELVIKAFDETSSEIGTTSYLRVSFTAGPL